MADNPADRYVTAVTASKGAAFLPVLVQLLEAKVHFWALDLHRPQKQINGTLRYLHTDLRCICLQVCPRCCLRHAGMRGDIYASAAPQVPELLSTLRASIDATPPTEQQTATASASEAHLEGAAESAVPSHTTGMQPEHDSLAPASGAGHISAVPQEACDKSSAAQNGQRVAAVDDSGSQNSKPAPCSVCLGVLQCIDSLQPATPSADVTTAVQQWDSSSNRAWQALASCTAQDIAAQVK